jgi:threonine/homoserine/homoserine lactone efflux protein
MSESTALWTFAGVMALGQFSLGPDMILLTRTALKSGARTGVKMACGIACGLSVHATLAFMAVSAPFLKENRAEWWPFAIWGIIVGQAF